MVTGKNLVAEQIKLFPVFCMNTSFTIQPIDESRRFSTNNFKPGDSLTLCILFDIIFYYFLTHDYTDVRTMRAGCCAPSILRIVIT